MELGRRLQALGVLGPQGGESTQRGEAVAQSSQPQLVGSEQAEGRTGLSPHLARNLGFIQMPGQDLTPQKSSCQAWEAQSHRPAVTSRGHQTWAPMTLLSQPFHAETWWASLQSPGCLPRSSPGGCPQAGGALR